jgi:hypothetical protein
MQLILINHRNLLIKLIQSELKIKLPNLSNCIFDTFTPYIIFDERR